jgi:hypothetical protein
VPSISPSLGRASTGATTVGGVATGTLAGTAVVGVGVGTYVGAHANSDDTTTVMLIPELKAHNAESTPLSSSFCILHSAFCIHFLGSTMSSNRSHCL